MYSNYGNMRPYNYSYTGNWNQRPTGNNDRVGGFIFPFVLGGLTGGLLAPAFYPRPYYQPYPYSYPYYPYYR